MSNYDNEFSKSDKLSSFPRKAQNWVRREFGVKKIPSNFVRKFKTCERLRTDLGWGSIIGLAGCVAFWNLKKSRYVRNINDKYLHIDPEILSNIGTSTAIITKLIGLGYYIKAIYDYKKC
ncbi:hypothetical protein LCGC14_0741690 [marine sediment metagenome]|uniref:Uncharacterized protein n=1 Tax=marine sediment metagenome TaxID=412755 RepID=A0A0F9Q6G6_9ZZZZ